MRPLGCITCGRRAKRDGRILTVLSAFCALIIISNAQAVDEFWTVMMRDYYDDYYSQPVEGPIEDLLTEYGVEYDFDESDGRRSHQDNIALLKDYLYEHGTAADLKRIRTVSWEQGVTKEKVDEAADALWDALTESRYDDYCSQTFPGVIEDLCVAYGVEYVLDDDGPAMHLANLQALKDCLRESGTLADLESIRELAEAESAAGSDGALSFSVDLE